MQTNRLQVLVVDDESELRASLCLELTELGYDVRSAESGFAALSEIRNSSPDILISDLFMPNMSGFELLSIVRRRFPSIQVIAMSGAFTGNTIPDGVPADGFYQKDEGIAALLKIVMSVSEKQMTAREESPIWFSQNGHDLSGSPYVTMACPECLRAFPLALHDPISARKITACIHCGISIEYAIAFAQYL